MTHELPDLLLPQRSMTSGQNAQQWGYNTSRLPEPARTGGAHTFVRQDGSGPVPAVSARRFSRVTQRARRAVLGEGEEMRRVRWWREIDVSSLTCICKKRT